eukprot:7788211-Ditylum_brightwellii.AAC.1
MEWTDLTFEMRSILTPTFGFDEEKWDCWMNHYTGYDWEQLKSSDLTQPFEALGWTEQSWNGEAPNPTSEAKSWCDPLVRDTMEVLGNKSSMICLTSKEMEAALELCYVQSTWNEVSMGDASFEDLPDCAK